MIFIIIMQEVATIIWAICAVFLWRNKNREEEVELLITPMMVASSVLMFGTNVISSCILARTEDMVEKLQAASPRAEVATVRLVDAKSEPRRPKPVVASDPAVCRDSVFELYGPSIDVSCPRPEQELAPTQTPGQYICRCPKE